jgi:hypothetical protein
MVTWEMFLEKITGVVRVAVAWAARINCARIV